MRSGKREQPHFLHCSEGKRQISKLWKSWRMDRLFERTTVSSLRHVSILWWGVTKAEFGFTHDLQLAWPDHRAQSCWSYFTISLIRMLPLACDYSASKSKALWLLCKPPAETFLLPALPRSRSWAPAETAPHGAWLPAVGTLSHGRPYSPLDWECNGGDAVNSFRALTRLNRRDEWTETEL